ncbi:MAG: single-stranded-DNA-specific exonuclease RecJ [Bacteroidales bacterium]|nr:single-stranded-DNA-specific exonuclease RecJ [Bacteroidales bacterium]
MEKKWMIKEKGNAEIIEELSKELNINKTLANLLLQRGITSFQEAKEFFRPDLNLLFDPFLMKDMDLAIDRINEAIENNEKILIYGDYDVDGTTSVALTYTFINKLHSNIDYYIPDRYTEGYGISIKGIDFAKENNFTLIIALDCGIKANEKINYAKKYNIDFIICDHHTPGKEIPDAVAVIDPKRKDCEYPFKELSGCGIGFKLIHAFSIKNNLPIDDIYSYLDLVAVSIASDIVPITGENRILTYYGLERINSTPKIGLKSIIKIAGIENREIFVNDIVFKIGPRINAAGRIESGKTAVKLLIADDENIANSISIAINQNNDTRKDLDRAITNEALETIESSDELINKKSTVLFNPEWHKGVVGIVASRLIETYYRPTVILTESNGFATGSARSVEGFNLYKAIEECSKLLENFGGHMYAAGLTMKIENVEKFQKKFEKVVSKLIKPEQLIAKINIDAEIDLEEITPKFYNILKQFQPYGPENMTPVFFTKQVKDYGTGKIVGKNNEHLKLDIITQNNDKIYNAIAFRQSHSFEKIKLNKIFDVCYTIEENNFKNRTTLQMKVRDIRN